MGNNWFWPAVIIGGVLVGGYFLLKNLGSALSDPKVISMIHSVTSEQFKQIVSDQANGLITQDEANRRLKALEQTKVNLARYY